MAATRKKRERERERGKNERKNEDFIGCIKGAVELCTHVLQSALG